VNKRRRSVNMEFPLCCRPRYNRGHSAGPWRHYGPSSHDACQLRVSVNILLHAVPATSSRAIGVG